MFDVDVRDTQVGLKPDAILVDAVVPHLLVKRSRLRSGALAVANDSGFRRIEELPVRLDYRFSESGLDLLAVAQALVDTAAIFYRLRILQYYRRRRRIVGERGAAAPLTTAVAFVGLEADELRRSIDALDGLEQAPSEVDVSLAAPRDGNDDVTARRLEVLERTDAGQGTSRRASCPEPTGWRRCSRTSRIPTSSPSGGRSCRASRAT